MAAPVSPKPDAVTTFHKKPYAAISPLRPELSQKGRVVYVTGGSAGIGLAICHAFAAAGAATVILTARREGPLNEAVEALCKEHPNTRFIGQPLDATDRVATDKAWAQLENDGVVVQVLVLNAAHIPDRPASVLELGYKDLWPSFVTNVGANLDLIDRFYHQKKRAAGQKLVSCCCRPRRKNSWYTDICAVARKHLNHGYPLRRNRQDISRLRRYKERRNHDGADDCSRSLARRHASAELPSRRGLHRVGGKAGVPESAFDWDDGTIKPF